jgi:hypothetical protein
VILVQASLILPARMPEVIPPAFVPVPHAEAVREVRLDIEGFPELWAMHDELVRLRPALDEVGEMPPRVQAAHGWPGNVRELRAGYRATDVVVTKAALEEPADPRVEQAASAVPWVAGELIAHLLERQRKRPIAPWHRLDMLYERVAQGITNLERGGGSSPGRVRRHGGGRSVRPRSGGSP